MPRNMRRRKVAVIPEDNLAQRNILHNIMNNVQRAAAQLHNNKYIKELQNLYEAMKHDSFMEIFTKMLQAVLSVDESNEFADPVLLFCAKYVTSYETEDTHPVLVSTIIFTLSKLSPVQHIRYRLCKFINMILNALGAEAALDDYICDEIMSYMIKRLCDVAPVVRVQAILALQRLQVPENPDDLIVKMYLYHLSSDPSVKVRQAVISSIGRNHSTIPHILERLWDVDEKIRRHTYLHMSSYPVKSYLVVQRLKLLEQGLSDRSENIRKVVKQVMLPQWLESYNKNIISFISGIKLDANEAEIDRFRKTAKKVLRAIFIQQKDINFLISNLPLIEDGEFKNCVTLTEISMETSIYWLCLIDFLQNEDSDELDLIIPDLSTFCEYIQKFCESSNYDDMDKYQKLEHQYILLALAEIVLTFDLGDEYGRENLKKCLVYLLENWDLRDHTIEVIVRCFENLISDQEARYQYFVDIIKNIYETKSRAGNSAVHDRNIIEELVKNQPDRSLEVKLSTLKFKMLDLEEQEMNYADRKDYALAQKAAEERSTYAEEYSNLLKPLLRDISSPDSEGSYRYSMLSSHLPKKISTDAIIKCLQISYHMVVSKNVKSLTVVVRQLYKDFIIRHIESSHIVVRDWALQCGTAYCLLYEPLSKEIYTELYTQFYKNHNVRIWRTSIDCIFELLDRYGLSHFDIADQQNKSRKLCNTSESQDGEEDAASSTGYGVDLIFLMSHCMDTCDDMSILISIVKGFCRLILHGHMKNVDIVEKLLIKYFNPVTDDETNQLLGIFFQNLIIRKKQEILLPSLFPTLSAILHAPYESPLYAIKPETVMRFVIESTQPMRSSFGLNIHNTMALSFMQQMLDKPSEKELVKVLARELTSLDIDRDDSSLISDLKDCCNKLLESNLDTTTQKFIENFKDSLDSNHSASGTVKLNGNGPNEKLLEIINEIDEEDTQEIVSQSFPDQLEPLEPEIQTTPTTFGLENSPKLNNLRKSLSNRKRSMQDLNTTPVKKAPSTVTNSSVDEIPASPSREIENQSIKQRRNLKMLIRTSKREAMEKQCKTEHKATQKNCFRAKSRTSLSFSPKHISDEGNDSNKKNEKPIPNIESKNKNGKNIKSKSSANSESGNNSKSDISEIEQVTTNESTTPIQSGLENKKSKSSVNSESGNNSKSDISKIEQVITNEKTTPIQSANREKRSHIVDENNNNIPKITVTKSKNRKKISARRSTVESEETLALSTENNSTEDTTHSYDSNQHAEKSNKKSNQNSFQLRKSVEKRTTGNKNLCVELNKEEPLHITRGVTRARLNNTTHMTINRSSSSRKARNSAP